MTQQRYASGCDAGEATAKSGTTVVTTPQLLQPYYIIISSPRHERWQGRELKELPMPDLHLIRQVAPGVRDQRGRFSKGPSGNLPQLRPRRESHMLLRFTAVGLLGFATIAAGPQIAAAGMLAGSFAGADPAPGTAAKCRGEYCEPASEAADHAGSGSPVQRGREYHAAECPGGGERATVAARERQRSRPSARRDSVRRGGARRNEKVSARAGSAVRDPFAGAKANRRRGLSPGSWRMT